MNAIDAVTLNFSPASLMLLNAILAVVMFAIALDLKPAQFGALIRAPRPVIAGFLAQFLALPAATYLLVLVVQPQPSVALGLILVAACPGGNISNFLSHRAGGNTALSVSLTGLATFGAIVLTPLNIALWGGLYAPTRAILVETAIDPVQVAITVVFLLIVPLALGMALNSLRPALAARIRRPLQILSMVIFVGFIVAALAANWTYFLDLAGLIAGLVVAHNALALGLGFGVATLAGLSARDRRSVTLETGIQNSGLGLILIFAFFNGLGGMAVVAAFWGMWHAVSGLALAVWWGRHPA
tara:strand:+ start:1309 stop:2205 length:897 start_codon:yes stop_codon:yes gene_type:complete